MRSANPFCSELLSHDGFRVSLETLQHIFLQFQEIDDRHPARIIGESPIADARFANWSLDVSRTRSDDQPDLAGKGRPFHDP